MHSVRMPQIKEHHYMPVPEAGCHLWLGSTNPRGFGKVMSAGKTWLAHRVAWMLDHGEIEKGAEIRHKCGTHNCVNPTHLYLFRPDAAVTEVDPVHGRVYGRRGNPIGHRGRRGYVYVYTELGQFFAHRLIWEMTNGPIPEGMEINHKNCVKDDNRIENLELVTPSENREHAKRMGRYCKQPGGVSRARNHR